jgi:hypothetical protein
MSVYRIRQVVETPQGRGSVQGGYADGKVLVRVSVTPENKKKLHLSETPRAVVSALWAFSGRELRAA